MNVPAMIGTVRKVILLNELDNNPVAAYRFSDPDGVKSGKSGWSFGICQFDINNNSMAALCLRECGFTAAEINALKAQTCQSMLLMDKKLQAARTVVDAWDSRQIEDCVTRVQQLSELGRYAYADDKAFVMAADYHNQFYLSKGGKFDTWAKEFGAPITDYDVYKFKLRLPWGMKREDDVKRRYFNVLKVMAA